MNFNEMKLMKPILRAIEEAGYQSPSPIQEQTIPSLLEGRDLLGCAQTGTGKTAAFALPIVQILARNKSQSIRGLILTPTRELCIQIQDNIKQYSTYTSVKSGAIFGGVSQNPQVAMLKKGVDFLVATPGRLIDLMDQGYIKLDKIEIFVMDEADRMLDMGFMKDINRITKLLPAKKQTLLFSATMPPDIEKLAQNMLKNPAVVKVRPTVNAVKKVKQSVYYVDKPNKILLLSSLLKQKDVDNAVVFTNTKYGADKIVKKLAKDKITAVAIHGDKGQTTRQKALNDFKDGKVKVLIATDIAARGIDVPELSHVFNYDIPAVPETYVHRIGRTGRAGKGGTAISFCNYTDLEHFKDVKKLVGRPIEEMKSKWPMEIME
ncbi:MAG: DEAD/DEAH box helicase [Lachnospiraceae bacterium]|nr:DEAD/DEAH box helicase [Lachnospiraceae bacterium]MDD3616366.1 DEAD/DEAH box helicase [Lachnospiraceae bacterium]